MIGTRTSLHIPERTCIVLLDLDHISFAEALGRWLSIARRMTSREKGNTPMATDIASEIERGTDYLERILERTPTTRVATFGHGVMSDLGSLIVANHGAATVVCVADETTWSVAGTPVLASLMDSALTVAPAIILPARPRPYADIDLVHRVRDALAAHPGALPIALGSGTLNDAVKLASAELETPYWVVGTAPSMDGYTAAGASISRDGFKQNIPCPAPYGVVMDLDVLQTAPQPMWASGFGDMIGKISALADWRVADAMGVETIDPWVWDLAKQSAVDALSNPSGVGSRDPEALPSLTVGLLMSGLSIQAYNSSRPGSGAEHMFSHLWEMEHVGLHLDPPLSHGAKVGIGSFLVAAFYDVLLDQDLTQLDVRTRCQSWPPLESELSLVTALHGDSPLASVAASQLPLKYPHPAELERRLHAARDVWPSLRVELRGLMKPARDIRDHLIRAKAHHHPHQIGLSLEQIHTDFLRLRSTRDRYTSVDLAAETGCLPAIIADLFTPSSILRDDVPTIPTLSEENGPS